MVKKLLQNQAFLRVSYHEVNIFYYYL